jgi:hypothetical protein
LYFFVILVNFCVLSESHLYLKLSVVILFNFLKLLILNPPILLLFFVELIEGLFFFFLLFTFIKTFSEISLVDELSLPNSTYKFGLNFLVFGL